MTPAERFTAAAPAILEAVDGGDPSAVLAAVRAALVGVQHYDLPLAWRHRPDPVFPSTVLVAAFHIELKSPNWFMSDWRRRSSLKAKWVAALWRMLCRLEGVASREGLVHLGLAPACTERMHIQVIRLAPNVRRFIRDQDNSAFVTKQMSDALNVVGLLKEDRREWYQSAPLLQDVSPIGTYSRDVRGRTVFVGEPVTVFVLRPAAMVRSVFAEGDRDVAVHKYVHAAPSEQVPADDGGTGRRGAGGGVRRRVGARTVDV